MHAMRQNVIVENSDGYGGSQRSRPTKCPVQTDKMAGESYNRQINNSRS